MISLVRQAIRDARLPWGETTNWLAAIPRLEPILSFLVSPKARASGTVSLVHVEDDLHPAIRNALREQLGAAFTDTIEGATSVALPLSQKGPEAEKRPETRLRDLPASVRRVALFNLERPTTLRVGDGPGRSLHRLMREAATCGLAQPDIAAMSKLMAPLPPETRTPGADEHWGRFTVSASVPFAGPLACLLAPFVGSSLSGQEDSSRNALASLLCADASLVARGAHPGFGTIILAEVDDGRS